jgi:ATP/maltotriose-dependent transcriptional regulator MalT
MEINEEELINKSMERLIQIKKKMKLPEQYREEDARSIFEDVSHEKRKLQIGEEKDKRQDKIFERKAPATQQQTQNNGQLTKDEKEKMKMELKHRYHFSQKPGHATNTQLAFIQELRKKANEQTIEIDVDLESVPKMTFSDADKEIKRLRAKLGWKDKQDEAQKKS